MNPGNIPHLGGVPLYQNAALATLGLANPNGVYGADPNHPMFFEMQARLAAAAAAQHQPVLLQRTEGATAADLGELEELGRMAQEDVEHTVSDEVFNVHPYQPILEGCLPHPGNIVEAGSLAALELPPVTYPLAESLPRDAVSQGKLSSLQLEGIVYACQRHQVILSSGTRAGFFLGDAAGVGKGRQISGVVLDNYARGRTKHVWFSISSDLIVDARRDLSDIGCYIKVIEGCQQLDKETKVLGLPADFKEGVVFSTYATLVSSVQKGGAFSSARQSRLQQLVDWCGGADFEGCLVFDECHKAKNFVPGKEQASTKVALAVTMLQRMLPRARVLYCSATGVSDVKNMAFMERLGMWGEGAAFRSFDEFLETVQRKGLGVAEMLAMEMKSSGMYVSRGLSYKQAEFVTVQIPLTKDQIRVYNTAVHVWNEVKRSLEAAIERTCCSNNRLWASFWASHQRFFKQLCMGMKVPALVETSLKALEDGYCVVIGLQTTGEASLESEMNKTGTRQTGFISLCREILSRFIEQQFPTAQEGQPAGGQSPAQDDWSVTAKQMLLGFAQQIKLPDSPLDEIIDLLGGPDSVAEMTGRRGRLVRRSRGQPAQYELRATDAVEVVESLNVRERNQFMSGKKLVAIISDAASTGISLHADLRAANQRRRIHITMELPWSADKAVQQLGRSHRSNQSSGPLYKLMTTDLGGERRFAAAVAKRLESLGALTKGDRRAASGADLSEFNFDTPYGRTALRSMYNAICQNHIAPGVTFSSIGGEGHLDFEEFNKAMIESLDIMGLYEKVTLSTVAKVKDKDSGDVSKFLNRILGISVERQNLIFGYFTQCLDAQIAMAKKEGRYNEGLVDITGSSLERVGEPREVFKGRNTSNNTTRHTILSVDRGMTWERAIKRLENNPGPQNGFYCSRRDTRGKKLYALATQKDGSLHLFKMARPNTGVSMFDEEKTDLFHKYVPIAAEKAEEGWRQQYDHSKEQCMHGPHCRSRGTCTVGSRCYKMHLLCGGIVTMMSLLETTIARYGPKLQLTKAESTLRVVRAKLDSGERVVGIRYPEVLIPLVEKAIEEEAIIKALMSNPPTTMSPGGAGGLAVPSPSSPSSSCLMPTAAVEGSLAVQQQTKTTPQRQPLLQDVSPVVSRLLNKATTPPVTIRSFFKPKTKTNSIASGRGADASSSSNFSVGCKPAAAVRASDTRVTRDEDAKSVETNKRDACQNCQARPPCCKDHKTDEAPTTNAKKSNSLLSSRCDSGSDRIVGELGSVKNPTTTTDSKNSRAKAACVDADDAGEELSSAELKEPPQKSVHGASTTPSPSPKPSCAEDTPGEKNETDGPHETVRAAAAEAPTRPGLRSPSPARQSTPGTKKRPATATGFSAHGRRPAKRAKQQTSIMSSFAKKTVPNEMTDDVDDHATPACKAISCPICGHSFAPGTWNVEVNKHIDNCLIE